MLKPKVNRGCISQDLDGVMTVQTNIFDFGKIKILGFEEKFNCDESSIIKLVDKLGFVQRGDFKQYLDLDNVLLVKTKDEIIVKPYVDYKYFEYGFSTCTQIGIETDEINKIHPLSHSIGLLPIIINGEKRCYVVKYFAGGISYSGGYKYYEFEPVRKFKEPFTQKILNLFMSITDKEYLEFYFDRIV